jgi:hypothetical protein
LLLNPSANGPLYHGNATKERPTFFLAIYILDARKHVKIILGFSICKSTDCAMVAPIHGQEYLARNVQAASIAIDDLQAQ